MQTSRNQTNMPHLYKQIYYTEDGEKTSPSIIMLCRFFYFPNFSPVSLHLYSPCWGNQMIVVSHCSQIDWHATESPNTQTTHAEGINASPDSTYYVITQCMGNLSRWLFFFLFSSAFALFLVLSHFPNQSSAMSHTG